MDKKLEAQTQEYRSDAFRRILLAFFWYNEDLHRGIAEFARKQRWSLELIGLPYHTYQVSGPPDGIITNLGFSDRLRGIVGSFDCPMVDLARNFPEKKINRVLCDHRKVS